MRVGFSHPRSVNEQDFTAGEVLSPSVFDSTVCNRDWLRAAAREHHKRKIFACRRNEIAKPLCSECEDTALDYHHDPLAGVWCDKCPKCEVCGEMLEQHEGYNETWCSSDLLHNDAGDLIAPSCAREIFNG